MARGFRLALFAGTLAIGTWLGLGKPTYDEARAFAVKVKAEADARAQAKAAASAPPSDDAKAKADASGEAKAGSSEESDAGGGADMRGRDLGNIPSLRPWPELNAEASIAKAWMVAEGPQYHAGSGRRLVTLTFDDGPFPETTPAVLKILAKNRIHASFFVLGRYLEGQDGRARQSREALKKVAAAGHLIGNHTEDHVLLTSVTHTQVLEQIDEGSAAIERVTGKRPILFRPPYGRLDEFGQQAVRERGLDLLLWSVEKQDMQREDSHEVFRELVGQLEYKEGGIVLLHDIRWTSVAVLRELLAWLKEHRWNPERPSRLGYEIVDLPTYLREVAASPLPYATRDELERAREAAARERGEGVAKGESGAKGEAVAKGESVAEAGAEGPAGKAEREKPASRPTTARRKKRHRAVPQGARPSPTPDDDSASD